MIKQSEKQCPRCESIFECKASDIENCKCSKLSILEQTNTFLQSTFYKDCLCNKCLLEIDKMVSFAHNNSITNNIDDLIEGVHYYILNNLLVFTELYHVQKGYCCKNHCRHCAYGFTLE